MIALSTALLLVRRSAGFSPRAALRLARGLTLVCGLLAGHSALAQLNVLYHLSFNSPASPWSATGSVAFSTTGGTPLIQSTDVAPGVGNTHSATFDGSQYQANTNFAGINTATTGYGVQLWVKNPDTNFTPEIWQNFVSFGFPADSGDRESENGITVGLYFGEYYGGSNQALESGSFPAIKSSIAPGGSGSINGWDHLAFVADGTQGRLYVNGMLQGTRTMPFVDPGSDWHLFAGTTGFPGFIGLADEVKLFTFASGTFSAAQLDYASAIPEPSTYAALAGLGALGLALYRRRRVTRRVA